MKKELIVDAVVLIACLIFIFSFFKPELLLSQNLTNGGDTGSHVTPAQYMHDYLLPHGKLIGWTDWWYAGMPMFQYYFPTPFALMSFFGLFVGLNAGFKLVTVLGTAFLPFAAYFSLRYMKFEFPVPAIGAASTLAFLFMEANSMWGGNIPSTLAGEFTYSISIGLVLLYIGSLYNGITEKKAWVRNGIILAGIGLTHIYTLLFAGIITLVFLADFVKIKENAKYISKVFVLGGSLVGFWFVPAMAKLGWRTPLDYVFNVTVGEVLPKILIPFIILAAFSFLLYRKDKRVVYLGVASIIPLLLYLAANPLGLVDIRFVPIFQLLAVVFSSIVIGKIVSGFDFKTGAIFSACAVATALLMHTIIKVQYYNSVIAAMIVIAVAGIALNKKMNFGLKEGGAILCVILIVLWTAGNVTFIQSWINWNYSGYEGKAYWPTLSNMTSFVKSLPYGRTAHEYSSTHEKFGTPRMLENMPLFTGKSTLEGLFIEGALTSPYMFYMQASYSEGPTCPIPKWRCSYYSAENATRYLKFFNIDYFVATSNKTKTEFRKTDAVPLKEFDEFEVFRLNNTGKYTEPQLYEPVGYIGKNWKKVTYEWFKDLDNMDRPIVVLSGPDKKFETIIQENGKNETEAYREIVSVPKKAVGTCETKNEKFSMEELEFDTDCIGKPVLIKISYYPNWHVQGADKVYLASPSFMIIYPTQSHVKLYYSDTIYDTLGNILSILGLLFLVFYGLMKLGVVPDFQKIQKHFRRAF
ncbi:MAG: hypothetical protein HY362_00200 [Candidatus Aenigmarchaeota archaeon]|nr:hypothetical protein [Candidatus Aenigmarchaeota archaeon]